MKKLLFFLLLIPAIVNAQWTKPNNSYGVISKRASFDSAVLLPTGCGLPVLNRTDSAQKKFAIYLDSCSHDVWWYDPSTVTWATFGSGGGANNYPTSFSAFSGGIITLNRNGLSAITVNIDGRYNKLSDTAAMLATYLRTNIAAATYVPLTRTLTINGTTFDLSANRTWTESDPSSWHTGALNTGVNNIGTGDNNDFVHYRNNVEGYRMTVGGGSLWTGNSSTGATPSSGAGIRMMWIPAHAAFRAGGVTGSLWDESNIGNYSASFGLNTKASNTASFAAGTSAIASGLYSFAGNSNTTASGTQSSAAFGDSTIAGGSFSFAIGNATKAIGAGAFASGYRTYTNSAYSIFLGHKNDTTGYGALHNSSLPAATDHLFVIGNGDFWTNTPDTPVLHRSNALDMLRNGNTTISGLWSYNKNYNGSMTNFSIPNKKYVDSLIGTVGGGTSTKFATTEDATATANRQFDLDDYNMQINHAGTFREDGDSLTFSFRSININSTEGKIHIDSLPLTTADKDSFSVVMDASGIVKKAANLRIHPYNRADGKIMQWSDSANAVIWVSPASSSDTWDNVMDRGHTTNQDATITNSSTNVILEFTRTSNHGLINVNDNTGANTISLSGGNGDINAAGTVTAGAYAGALPVNIAVAASDESTALTTGNKLVIHAPYNFTLTDVMIELSTAQTSGSIFRVEITKGGSTIFSTKPTIDNTEETSRTAATAPVISVTSVTAGDKFVFNIDQIGDGTAKGLKIWLLGHK